MDVKTLATRENQQQNCIEWLLCLRLTLPFKASGQDQWLYHRENPAIVQMLWVGGISWQPDPSRKQFGWQNIQTRFDPGIHPGVHHEEITLSVEQ